MYRFINIIFCFFIASVLVSCGEDPFCNCLQPTGKTASENRTLPSFQKIEVFNNVNVNIHISNEHKAVVTCGKNLIDGVETVVEDGKLKIRNINRCNWIRNPGNEFNIDIYTPAITDVFFKGSGNITCVDTIKSESLNIECWSATGIAKLLLDCNNSYLTIHTGPADIIADGNTNLVNVYNTGNGYIRAEGLKANVVNVTSKSTGDCYVNSSGRLAVNIKYQGDVYYKGQPVEIEQIITGSGQLIAY